MAMQQVELGGPFKGINEVENEQQEGEFDFLVNAELHNGYMCVRQGWEVLGKAFTDATEAGGDYSTAHNIVAATYSPTLAYKSRAYCLGGWATRLDSGLLNFVTVWRQYNGTGTWSVIFQVYDSVGDPVGSAVNLTTVYGEPADGARPYIFTEYADRVTFSCGNGIFQWSVYGGSQLDLVSFIVHPVYGSSYIWITSPLRPRLVTTHKDRTFYAAFPEDMLLTFSSALQATDDTAPFQPEGTSSTPTAIRPGLKTQIGGQALFFPSQVMWSEPMYQQCVMASSFWNVPDGQAVTAMAEFKENLIVWTCNAMFALSLDVDGNVEARKISDGNGCVAQRSVVTTPDGRLIWASRDGLFVFDGQQVKDVSRRITRTYHGIQMSPFPRQNAEVRSALIDCRIPGGIDLDRMEWASAVNFRTQNQYWLAVPTKTSEAPNSLIIVYDYEKDRFWYHASRESDSDTPANRGVAGWDVLFTDPNVNDVLYACTRSFAEWTSATPDRLAKYSGQFCVYGGDWDESVSTAGARLRTRIPLIAIGGRVGLTTDSKIAGAVAKLRLFGTHNHDFDPTEAGLGTERPVLCSFTEGAGADQWRASQPANDLQEQNQGVSTWPEPGGSGCKNSQLATPSSWQARYFWQPASGTSTAFNVWDDSVTPLDPATSPTLKWLADEVFEQVVPIPFYPNRWMRLCLYSSPTSIGHQLRLVSWSVVVSLVGREAKA